MIKIVSAPLSLLYVVLLVFSLTPAFSQASVISNDPFNELTKLIPLDPEPFNHFGKSVSISGGVALVGSDFDNDNGSSSGSAYVFRFDGTNWVETKLLAPDGAVLETSLAPVSLST